MYIEQEIAASLAIGAPVSGGTPDRFLYIDSSGNLADSANAQFDGTDATFGGNVSVPVGESYQFGGTDWFTVDADENVRITDSLTGSSVGTTVGGVFVGSDVMYNNGALSSTDYSIHIGYNINDLDVPVGEDNIYIGRGVSRVGTTSYGLVAIGFGACEDMEEGELCVYTGPRAGRRMWRGVYNTVSGWAAGYGATSGEGERNTYSGAYCGYHGGDDFNSAFGAYSSYSNPHGDYNSTFGYSSGYTSYDKSRCIMIGSYAGYYSNTDEIFVIDNYQRADAATEITDAFMWGDMDQAVANRTLRLNTGNLTLWGGDNTDVTINFFGTTNSGSLVWDESAGTHIFSDGVSISDTLTVENVNIPITGAYQIAGADWLKIDASNNLIMDPDAVIGTAADCVIIGNDTFTQSGNSTQYSIFIGPEVADSATMTGDNNIGIGRRTIRNVTSGYDVTAIARGAGALLTTGYRDFFAGANSGLLLTTAHDCFCAGAFSGYGANKTDGHFNTYLGSYSGRGGGGNYNFGAGPYSLYSINTGAQNIALGPYGLYNLTIGTNNFSAGFESGYNMTSQSRCILVGRQSGFRNTSSDVLIIDNQDRGSAAAEVTDCLVYGTMDASVPNQTLRFNAPDITFWGGANTDVTLSFLGTSNNGTLVWDESAAEHVFSDDVRVTGDTILPNLTASKALFLDSSKYVTTSTPLSSAYTPTNVSTDRAYDADSTTLDEIADVLGTLIADLQSLNIIP